MEEVHLELPSTVTGNPIELTEPANRLQINGAE